MKVSVESVKNQFMSICSKYLSVHLRENSPKDLEESGNYAEWYMVAHDQELFSVMNRPIAFHKWLL